MIERVFVNPDTIILVANNRISCDVDSEWEIPQRASPASG